MSDEIRAGVNAWVHSVCTSNLSPQVSVSESCKGSRSERTCSKMAQQIRFPRPGLTGCSNLSFYFPETALSQKDGVYGLRNRAL